MIENYATDDFIAEAEVALVKFKLHVRTTVFYNSESSWEQDPDMDVYCTTKARNESLLKVLFGVLAIMRVSTGVHIIDQHYIVLLVTQ